MKAATSGQVFPPAWSLLELCRKEPSEASLAWHLMMQRLATRPQRENWGGPVSCEAQIGFHRSCLWPVTRHKELTASTLRLATKQEKDTPRLRNRRQFENALKTDARSKKQGDNSLMGRVLTKLASRLHQHPSPRKSMRGQLPNSHGSSPEPGTEIRGC